MQRSLNAFSYVFLAVLFGLGCSPESPYKTPDPPKVSAVKPKVETIPVFMVENGETEAVDESVVEARVRGILGKAEFEADSFVKKDQLLFVIEKEEYQAAVQAASAAVTSAKATLASANASIVVADAKIDAADADILLKKVTYDRMSKLIKTNAISKTEYDTAVAEWETAKAKKKGEEAAKVAAEADVKNALAGVDNAEAKLVQSKLNLKWCDVKAPIAGRVTRTLVKEGNMVDSRTALIEIVRNDPIWANFNVSERFLLDMERQANRKDDDTLDPTNIKVELQRSGDQGFPFKGHLDYYDPRIDQDTGTLQLRAVFENKPEQDNNLLPGLFVRVRIQIGQVENAILVPERAVSRDQVGSFVYVVGGDSKAERRNVKVGTKSDDSIVITSGIAATDLVIVDGIQRVRPGVVVDPR